MHLTSDFIQLFSGLTTAHGTYKLTGDLSPNGKAKGVAVTHQAMVTVELWNRHLRGEQGLGIIPINEHNCCRFGAIDVDIYPLNLKELNARIQFKKLPLVLCRTKSGGAHLFLFVNEWVSAETMIHKLKEMAAALGHGRAEVFPKQSKLLIERGDVGSWINMPYFMSDKTNRYGLDDCGVALNIEQFIKYAVSQIITLDQLRALTCAPDELLPDGPPCLQHLVREGFPEGMRNAGMFNLGIYAKKAHPDAWRAKLEEYNSKFMSPPLTSTEILGVIKSLDKHDYNYTCKSQPIEAHCNVDKCRRCKFGVGKGDYGMPKLGTLTKLQTSPPIWFLDIEGGTRLELTTEELQSPIMFQKRCMEVLHVVPGIPKRNEWTDILGELFENVNMVDVPESTTPKGLLLSLFEEFINSRVRAKCREEVLLGKPLTQDGKIIFRMKDFIRFLDRQRFNTFDLSQITVILREVHGMQDFRFRVDGKLICALSVNVEEPPKLDAVDLPKLPNDLGTI